MKERIRKPSSGATLNPLPTRRQRRTVVEPIDELAINGPEAELIDMVDGRRFLYHFEQDGLPLELVVEHGLARFYNRYGQHPKVVILSDSYGLVSGQKLAGLEIMAVAELPWYHFWFGPKPDFQQLTLNF